MLRCCRVFGWSTLFLDTESRRNAAFSSVSEQPRRASFRGTRALLTPIRRGERALSIDQFGDLSIASSAAANAWPQPVERGAVVTLRTVNVRETCPTLRVTEAFEIWTAKSEGKKSRNRKLKAHAEAGEDPEQRGFGATDTMAVPVLAYRKTKLSI